MRLESSNSAGRFGSAAFRWPWEEPTPRCSTIAARAWLTITSSERPSTPGRDFSETGSPAQPRPVYKQDAFIDLEDSPAPDWSLIESKDYLSIPVQTTRGCPNRCDFCDVIQYLGRKPRVKPIRQVLDEIEAAHALGANAGILSDDNFLGNKAFTRRLLPELVEWNRAQPRPLQFSTQITSRRRR